MSIPSTQNQKWEDDPSYNTLVKVNTNLTLSNCISLCVPKNWRGQLLKLQVEIEINFNFTSLTHYMKL